LKLKAVLFDLDDTLLVNDMARFGPAFYDLIGDRGQDLIDPARLIATLAAAIRAVLDHDDPLITNEQRFWQEFVPHAGVSEDQLRQLFARFYAVDFPQLRSLTQPHAEARVVVQQAKARGLKTALATNPMFPETAILQRMRWGGLSVADFDVITTLENSYVCKPRAAYFSNILQQLEACPSEALMIGDDWRLDIAPAIELGLKTFWLNDRRRPHPNDPRTPTATGTWIEFVNWWQAPITA
jgi:FMN phosphatase YigB (HAD superfamily)